MFQTTIIFGKDENFILVVFVAQVIEIPILLQRRYANGLAQFQLPAAVHDRLQFLLDRQDAGTQLSEHERLEAEGLVELAEFLSLLKLRSHQVTN